MWFEFGEYSGVPTYVAITFEFSFKMEDLPFQVITILHILLPIPLHGAVSWATDW